MNAIYFCHIPKTGGTGVRLAIESAFDQSEIVPNAAMLARFGGLYPPIEETIAEARRLGPTLKAISGHYPLSLAGALHEPVTITVLRDPVSRIISQIKHQIRSGAITEEQAYKSLDAGRLPPEVPGNAMAEILTVGIIADNRPPPHPLILVFRALVCAAQVDILGVLERFDLLREQLRAIGIDLPECATNVATNDLRLTKRHIAVIRRRNRLDRVVYRGSIVMLGLPIPLRLALRRILRRRFGRARVARVPATVQ